MLQQVLSKPGKQSSPDISYQDVQNIETETDFKPSENLHLNPGHVRFITVAW